MIINRIATPRQVTQKSIWTKASLGLTRFSFAREIRRQRSARRRGPGPLALAGVVWLAAVLPGESPRAAGRWHPPLGAIVASIPSERAASFAGLQAAPAIGEQADEHAADEEHRSGVRDLIARLFNFGILAGVLLYFLRSPLATYLQTRGTQIRGELADAAAMQAAAAQQIEAIDRKLTALPDELEALKARGAREVEAEQARIQQAAEAERQRLLEQSRREIDLHLRVAKRELVKHAADLAVGVASERIAKDLTTEDQLRLVDSYVDQVRKT